MQNRCLFYDKSFIQRVKIAKHEKNKIHIPSEIIIQIAFPYK